VLNPEMFIPGVAFGAYERRIARYVGPAGAGQWAAYPVPEPWLDVGFSLDRRFADFSPFTAPPGTALCALAPLPADR
jgi:hypothetical protein